MSSEHHCGHDQSGRYPPSRRHFAVIASPVPGHLNPLQVLGAELVALGHRVTVVHVGGAARFVTDPAVGFAPLPEGVAADLPFDAYLTTLARPTGPLGLTRMIRQTATMIDALLAGAPEVLARIGADAVIADAAEPAGPLIARRIGLPHVASVTGLPLLREPDVPPPFVGWRYTGTAAQRFHIRGAYGVSDRLMRPVTRVLDARRCAWGVPGGDGGGEGEGEPLLHVAQCPAGFDFPRRQLPPGFLYGSPWRQPQVEDVELPDDGRPLVFCSLGTLQGARPALFAVMARACAAAGARAVIGHGGGLSADDEARLPGRPLVRAFWPQRAVLRRCVAAVLHGGFNTVLDALSAGVPIVALPIAFEQPATAARLARIGAGRVLSPRGLRAERLAAALEEVMRRESYRVAAGRIAAEMARGGGAAGAAAAINRAIGGAPGQAPVRPPS